MSDAKAFDVVASLEGHAQQMAYVRGRDRERARYDGWFGGVPFLDGRPDEEPICHEEKGEDGQDERGWGVC